MSIYIQQTDTMYKLIGEEVIVIEHYSQIKEYEEQQENKYY